jgi:tetratricopeptide (TPR) repeat protein
MASDDFDTLVNQANLLAGSGNWQVAYGKLVQAEGLQPENPGLLNGIGTCLLQLGRPAEAVKYLKKVNILLPDSPDALHNLGLAYAAMGIFPLAEAAYRDALTLDPDFRMAIRSLAVVCIKQEERIKEGLEMLIALIKDNPEDIETLLILASSYEEGEQYTSAKDLCQYVLNIEPENENALETLERLSALEAGASQSAQLVIPESPGDLRIDESKPVSSGWLGGRSIIFYGGYEFSNAIRLMVPAQVLQRGGMNVKYASEIDPKEMQNFDTFVFSRPHLKQEWVDAFQACMRAGKRIILDIDGANFDSELFLFDSAGNVVDNNDDDARAIDNGQTSSLESFIEYIA